MNDTAYILTNPAPPQSPDACPLCHRIPAVEMGPNGGYGLAGKPLSMTRWCPDCRVKWDPTDPGVLTADLATDADESPAPPQTTDAPAQIDVDALKLHVRCLEVTR